MSSSHTRVVVTGFGVISPLGRDLETFWKSLQSGTSGITEFEGLPLDVLPVKHGGQVKCFTGEIEEFGPMEKMLQRSIKKSQKLMCREIAMGVAACQLALHHANFPVDKRDPNRIGITYGCDYILTRPEEFTDGIKACFDDAGEFQLSDWPTKGMPQVNPLWLLKFLPNMPASHVAIFNDLRGPSNSLTVREASNALTFAEAAAGIRRGASDVMIVGSTGSRIEPLRLLHVLNQEKIATDRDPPSTMCRPFDLDRNGIVLGEGAAAFVLESLDHAIARGANIVAEVVATSASTVGPQKDGSHIRTATKNILSRVLEKMPADLKLQMHIHAAGRGDVLMDIAESQGIHDCIGDKKLPVVAAKSYFGSLGAGGAAVEVAASLLALQNDELFATANCTSPDPACPVRLSTEKTKPGKAFVHLAYSPQGQASAVCLAKYIG